MMLYIVCLISLFSLFLVLSEIACCCELLPLVLLFYPFFSLLSWRARGLQMCYAYVILPHKSSHAVHRRIRGSNICRAMTYERADLKGGDVAAYD